MALLRLQRTVGLALLLTVFLGGGPPGRTQAQTVESPCDGLLEALKGQATGLGAPAGAVTSVTSLAQARTLLDAIAKDDTDEYGKQAKAAAANAVVQIDACLKPQNAPAVDPGAAQAPPAAEPGAAPPAPGPAPNQPAPGQPAPILPFAEQGGAPRGGAPGGAATQGGASPSGGRADQDPGAVDLARPATLLRPSEPAIAVPAQSRAAIGPARPLMSTGPAPSVRRIDRASGNLVPFTDGQVRDGDTLQLGANTALPFTMRGPDGKLATGTLLASETTAVTFGPSPAQVIWDRLASRFNLPNDEPLPPAAIINISGSATLRLWTQPQGEPPPPISVSTAPSTTGQTSSVVVELYRTLFPPEVGGHVSILESINRLLDQAAVYIRQADEAVSLYLFGKMEVQNPRREQTESLIDVKLRQSLTPSTTIQTPGFSTTHKDTAFSVEYVEAGGTDRTTVVVTEGSVTVRDLGSGELRTITAGNTEVFKAGASTANGAGNGAKLAIAAAAIALVAFSGGAVFFLRRRSRST